MKHLLLILLLTLPCAWAGSYSLADLDAPDFRLFYEGTIGARAGMNKTFGFVNLGGFVEVQNEARFNQGMLPNHRWRGVARWESILPAYRGENTTWAIPFGFRHESSHASMGIEEPTTDAYQMIFDGNYRNTNRNAFSLGGLFQWKKGWSVQLRADALGYLYSRNTPEALSKALTSGFGGTVGLDFHIPVGNSAVLFSTWFRQELESSEKFTTQVYFQNSQSLEAITLDYPIFVATHSFVTLLGLELPWFDRAISLYTQLLIGNPGGFVDSRANRQVISAGLRIQ